MPYSQFYHEVCSQGQKFRCKEQSRELWIAIGYNQSFAWLQVISVMLSVSPRQVCAHPPLPATSALPTRLSVLHSRVLSWFQFPSWSLGWIVSWFRVDCDGFVGNVPHTRTHTCCQNGGTSAVYARLLELDVGDLVRQLMIVLCTLVLLLNFWCAWACCSNLWWYISVEFVLETAFESNTIDASRSPLPCCAHLFCLRNQLVTLRVFV